MIKSSIHWKESLIVNISYKIYNLHNGSFKITIISDSMCMESIIGMLSITKKFEENILNNIYF